jgi:hypothetical protein
MMTNQTKVKLVLDTVDHHLTPKSFNRGFFMGSLMTITTLMVKEVSLVSCLAAFMISGLVVMITNRIHMREFRKVKTHIANIVDSQ